MEEGISKAARLIRESQKPAVFTGAGISAESGIPTFRGENGVWKKYDPEVLELDYFYRYPEESWKVIKEIFYNFMHEAKPNAAHHALAAIEKLKNKITIITQNIDHFHQQAGNTDVVEFHGTTAFLLCEKCQKKYQADKKMLERIPPHCPECKSVLKPDFVFFGEGIPPEAYARSFQIAASCDLMIVVGTSGEVMPANMIPQEARRHGAYIVEINPEKKVFAFEPRDVYIKGKAGEVLPKIVKALEGNSF
ncbi:MAG TPA: RNA polymerase subunit sigma [Bacteroidales bacterium]|nr:RNA polymerase subunit sigma [Bacteroidales bacterium]HCY22033.1 RNA polymerase subunit sigma [Bacteroidales bacterium]